MIGITSIIISAFVTVFFFLLSKIDNPRNIEGIIFLAQASGLATSMLISWNFILATRSKFLEEIFGGLDKVYTYHKIIGNLAFIFAISHPIFLILGSLPYNLTKLYLVPSVENVSYALGIFALYLLMILIATTIFIDIPYRFWKKTHEFIGLVIILGGLHSILVSSDISYYFPLKVWMISWNIIAIAAYIYKRFFYYLFIPKNNYIIKNIIQEKDYLLVNLVAKDKNNIINFKSGQFAYFSLEKDRRDDHPFSVLEQMSENLTIGTKLIGSFTHSLANQKIDTQINVFGPFGFFSSNIDLNKNMLWISGGIGITPFISMAKSLKNDQKVTMIHTSRSDEATLFSNMLIEISNSNPNFKFINYHSDIDGHLDRNKIDSIVKLNPEFNVYLCGPQKMMESLSEILPSLGIQNKKIIFEDFALK